MGAFFCLNLQYIRCAQSDFGCDNVTEPPVDARRDPLYKSEREIEKVWAVIVLMVFKALFRKAIKLAYSLLN